MPDTPPPSARSRRVAETERASARPEIRKKKENNRTPRSGPFAAPGSALRSPQGVRGAPRWTPGRARGVHKRPERASTRTENRKKEEPNTPERARWQQTSIYCSGLKGPRGGPRAEKVERTKERTPRETPEGPTWQQTSIYCSRLRAPRGARDEKKTRKKTRAGPEGSKRSNSAAD